MQVPIENKGTSTLFVGDLMIQPGEIRLVEASLLPAHLRPGAAPAAAPAPLDPVAVLAEKNLAEIREGVEVLTAAQLDRLVEIENAKEKPRSGVADAVTREKLRRAEAQAKLEDFNRAVTGMNDTQLQEYRKNVEQHPELVAAVDAEVAARMQNTEESAEDEAP